MPRMTCRICGDLFRRALRDDLATAIAVGQDALASEILPTAAVWAALAAGGALALSGRFSEGIEVAEIGSRAAESCESGPQRYALGFIEIFALTGSGDLAAAEQVCQHYTAMTSGVPQAEAIVAEGRADAVLAASIFHFGEYTVRQAKEYMRSRGVEVRL